MRLPLRVFPAVVLAVLFMAVPAWADFRVDRTYTCPATPR